MSVHLGHAHHCACFPVPLSPVPKLAHSTALRPPLLLSREPSVRDCPLARRALPACPQACCSPLSTSNQLQVGREWFYSEDYFGEYLSKHLITQGFNPCLMDTFSGSERLRERPEAAVLVQRDAATTRAGGPDPQGNSISRPEHKGEHQPSPKAEAGGGGQ